MHYACVLKETNNVLDRKMDCKEKQSGWVKAFGIMFAVLTAFSFFGVSFYLSKTQLVKELNKDENKFGEWEIIHKAILLKTGIQVDLKLFYFIDLHPAPWLMRIRFT